LFDVATNGLDGLVELAAAETAGAAIIEVPSK
jgi:hypothetical protein